MESAPQDELETYKGTLNIPTEYGLSYPITKTSGSWLVVGAWKNASGTDVIGFDIHFDGDDPNFCFLRPEDFPEVPTKTIEQYNFPYRKAGRLALRRVTNFYDIKPILDAACRAEVEIAIVLTQRLFSRASIRVEFGSMIRGIVPNDWDGTIIVLSRRVCSSLKGLT